MMVTDVHGPAGKDERLSVALASLANPARISILRKLCTPRFLKDLEVYVPSRDEPDHQRLLARQTVKEHLDRLVKEEIVVARTKKGDYGVATEYVVNQQRLYHLTEEFRSLARLRPPVHLNAETASVMVGRQTSKIQGPCLVLVKGVDEGRVFSLTGRDENKEWVVGRNTDTDIVLDYDPFVSSKNSMLRSKRRGWTVEDLSESRNGTAVNFDLIPKGQPVALQHGDILGIGRSLLLFYG